MVVIETFLRWLDGAGVSDRARAANALGRAFLGCRFDSQQSRAAHLAMSHLLDDPSPRVRLALAQALASSVDAPRSLVMALAEDQPEIACTIIAQSPVLSDEDLVDLVGRGNAMTRAIVATRTNLAKIVAAALAEVGGLCEVTLLLENASVASSRTWLMRVASRFGHDADIRRLLLQRQDLPAEARQDLAAKVAQSLVGSDLVRSVLTGSRLERLSGEAIEAAAVQIAGSVRLAELPSFVEHMRVSGQLTPALLIHALCSGKAEFFVAAIANLSGLDDNRVRSLLANARLHALRALFEASGLVREIAMVFVDATMLWRNAGMDETPESICEQLVLISRAKGDQSSTVTRLVDMVERLQHGQTRQAARSYAERLALAA